MTLLRLPLIGFAIAACGAAMGFFAFYIEVRPLAIVGYFVTLSGVIIGFVGIIIGGVRHGRSAVKGSLKSARGLFGKPKS